MEKKAKQISSVNPLRWSFRNCSTVLKSSIYIYFFIFLCYKHQANLLWYKWEELTLIALLSVKGLQQKWGMCSDFINITVG